MTDPTLPLTYPDLVCVDDLDPFASETTSDLQNLTQDVLHLLRELPGSNPDDPTRGVGVEAYLSGPLTAFARLPSIIDAQLSTDDRIDSSKTTIISNGDQPPTIQINLVVNGQLLSAQFGFVNGTLNQLGPV